MGGAITTEIARSTSARIVAGAANNQLAEPVVADILSERGVLYAPDYVINAGGIIDVYYQQQGVRDKTRVNRHLATVADTLNEIFNRADREARPTALIADELAEERLLIVQRAVA